MSGLKTVDVPEETLVDEIVGNKDGSSGRISFENFSQQLLGAGPVAEKFDLIEDQVLSGLSPASSWADLMALVPVADDVGSSVPDTDAGTHLQATATGYDGASVPNAGVYRWVATWSRWLRVSDTALSGKADAAATTAALATKADAVATASALADKADAAATTAALADKADAAATTAALATKAPQSEVDDLTAKVNALDAAIVLQDVWDASVGTFPGAGSAQSGHLWIVSVAGTVDGVSFGIGDRIVAITDDASTTTFAGNWFKEDYTPQVLSVNAKTGVVSLDKEDVGLGQVDNTPDSDKEVSGPQQTALNMKPDTSEFVDRIQNTGGRVQFLPDGHGGSALDFNAKTRLQETPFPLVSRQERQNDGGVFAEVIQEGRTVGGWRGGERFDLVPTHASQRLALLADTHGIQQLFLVSENPNHGTNWARQLTFAPRPITGYDWVRLPTASTPGIAQIARADQPFTKRRHMLGRVEVPIKVPVATTPTSMLFVAIIGQSNSVGAVNPYNNTTGAQLVYDLMLRPHGPLDADLLRFNGGVLPHQDGVGSAERDTAINAAQLTSFVPLREGDNDNGEDRETFMSALALQLNGAAGFDRDRYILTGSFGFGSSAFEDLILDGVTVKTAYQNMLDAVQAAQDICDAESLDLEVVVVFDQGEANSNTPAADFRDLLTGWHSDMVTRVGAITGQSEVKLFISQTMTCRGNLPEPTLSALGQALAADANADIHLLPPSYFTDPDEDPYKTPGSYAVVHHSATGHQWRGSVYGAAMAQVLIEESDPSLRILSATWSGSQITITWNQPDVVIDCDTIRNLGTALGLSRVNSTGGSLTISRVYMSAPNQTIIQLSGTIPAASVETIKVGDSDINNSGNWMLGYAKGPRTPFRRREPIGYSMIDGSPLYVFANIEEFTATEA